MIIVPKRQIWTRQPTEPVDIDWSNPLSRGLVFANPLRPSVGMIDVVRRQLSATLPTNSASNKHGVFARLSNDSLSYAALDGLSPTTPLSISWIQQPLDTMDYGTVFEIGLGAGNKPVHLMVSSSDVDYAFLVGIRNTAQVMSYYSGIGLSNSGVTDHFTLTMSGGPGYYAGYTLYRNGSVITGSLGNVFSDSSEQSVLIGSRPAGVYPYKGVIGNFQIRTIALDELGAKSLYDNQWQIYKRRSRHVFVGASGGGDVSLALSGSLETFAAGSLSPQVTVALSGNSLTSAQGSLGPGLGKTLSGSVESFAAGTLSGAVQLALSGNALTFAFGTLTVSSGYVATLTGLEQTFFSGSLAPGIALALSGNASSLAYGTVTVGAAYIVALTGLEQTISSGTLSPEIELSINGQVQTVAFGLFSPEIQTELTGRSMTLTPGTLSIAGGSGGIGSLDPATIAAIAAAIWSDPRAPTIAKLLAIKDG